MIYLFRNVNKPACHYSFSKKPLNSSFIYKAPKLVHAQSDPIPEPEKDYSQIIMKGRKFSNAPISQKLVKLKRKGKSQPKCQCEVKKNIKISRWSHKIPFFKDSKWSEDTCPNSRSQARRRNNHKKWKSGKHRRVPDSNVTNDDINPSYYLTFGSRM